MRRLPRSVERQFTPDLVAEDVPADAVTTSASGVDPQISVRQRAHPGQPRRRRARHVARATCSQPGRRRDQPAAARARRAEVRERRRAQRSPLEAQSMTDRPEPLAVRARHHCGRRSPPRSRKLDPRLMARNPVMFVVEIGAVLTTLIWIVQAFGGDAPGGGGDPAWFTFTVAIWLWLTVAVRQLRRGDRRGPRQGAGRRRCARCARRPSRGCEDGGDEAGQRARARRRGRRRGRRGDPRRRHRHRGHRLGRRVGHHRRVGARHPRVRRRPQRGHRRHARALRPHRRRDHAGAGPVVSSTA